KLSRYIKIKLEKRNISCIARLLDEDAPNTCDAIWNSLPQCGPAYHAKYAKNEVYTMVPSITEKKIGLENPTVTPIHGDLCYFYFDEGELNRNFKEVRKINHLSGVVDLAIFYGRNNLLLNGDIGWVPGNVFATVEENLKEMADACNDIWMSGMEGERLIYEKHSS